MKIEVNGEPAETSAATLESLLGELGYEPNLVATARNGSFVRRAERAQTSLQEQDRIEILVPRQGG